MTNFNERTNTLLYKNIISHTLFLKRWCWLWVRYELETGIDCYIDPKFFFDHSSTSSSSWLGCSTVGYWGPKALCLPLILNSASCLQLTRTAPGTWLYYCLTYTCFRCSSAYLHRCISWSTAQTVAIFLIWYCSEHQQIFFVCLSYLSNMNHCQPYLCEGHLYHEPSRLGL